MAKREEGPTAAKALGAREFAVLIALAEHKILATSQIAVLFFGSERSTQRILHVLRSAGLIESFAWRETAREADRHFLTPLGAQLVASHLGCRVAALGAMPRDADHAATLMPHRSGVNAFFCGLVEQTRGRPGYGLETWRDEHKVRTPYGEVQPDGFGRLLHPGGASEFYFEYDRSTENRAALLTKLTSYPRIASTWQGIDDRPFPSVLFVATKDDRELALLKALLAATGRWDPARATSSRLPFYCSTVARLKSKGHLGAVWRDMLASSTRLRLDELAAIDGSAYDLSACLGRRWQKPEEASA
jgi:hypothetical protein